MGSYTELTAYELRNLIQKGDLKAEELIHTLFERIDEVETDIKAFVTLTKKHALTSAKAIDKKVQGSNKISLLAGIPVAIKDNICTKDIRTTCSSKMLDNYVPPYSATVIERLQHEGAIIIGKTNMDEFAMGTTTESSFYQITHNPWNLDCVPGGSSGGSAAAVAAEEAIIALGSDTGGSIRCPASFTGITGMKVTYGLISRYGLISYACSLEQIGPLVKTVRDCALLLNILTGHDPLDSTTLPMQPSDYLSNLQKDIKGVRIGIPKEFMGEGTDSAVSQKVWNAIQVLESLGASYEEVSIPLINYGVPTYYIIAMSEASSNLARYDGIRYGHRIAQDEGNWNEAFAEDRMGLGPEVRRRIMLGTYALSAGYYDMYYLKALKVRTLLRKQFETKFKTFDVIAGPTMPSTAFKIGEKISDPLSMYRADIDTVSANITGLPSLSIPCGFSHGLPIGLQLTGNSLQESLLLQVGHNFQKVTDFHTKRPPMK